VTAADLPPVEIETGPAPVASIIWLHGLGADGHDFEPIVPELGLAPVRFVFPHAPYRPVSLNNGYVMRAWYDLDAGPVGYVQNRRHLEEAAGIVAGLVRNECERGMPPGRILLAGFSQGGVVVLTAGLSSTIPLAGIVSLSAPVVEVDGLLAQLTPAGRTTPVFLGHGTDDEMVPVQVGRVLQQRLAEAGIGVEWHEYPTGHGVTLPEIHDITAWIGKIIAS
jgi:phospholipase/carboxylesterase